METINCKVVEEKTLEMMSRHMDNLRGRNKQLRRDRDFLFFLFVITAMALAYIIGQGPV